MKVSYWLTAGLWYECDSTVTRPDSPESDGRVPSQVTSHESRVPSQVASQKKVTRVGTRVRVASRESTALLTASDCYIVIFRFKKANNLSFADECFTFDLAQPSNGQYT